MSDSNQTVYAPVTYPVTVAGKSLVMRCPSFRSIVKLISELLTNKDTLINKLSDTEVGTSDIIALFADDATYDLFMKLSSACTGEPPEFFGEVDVATGVNLVKGIIQVVDFKEIMAVFQSALTNQPT